MEDKAELLTRLEQTLAFIEVKLHANTADKVRAAYDAAGAMVLQDVARLSDVRVADAVPLDADLLCTQLKQMRCAADATDLTGMITATFESELSATGRRAPTGLRAIWLVMMLVTWRWSVNLLTCAALRSERAWRRRRIRPSAPPRVAGSTLIRYVARAVRCVRDGVRCRRNFPSCSPG